MKLTLRVAYPGAAERRFRLTERVVVGSSADCAISLPDSGMLPEHFSVRADAEGAKIRLANGAPPMGHNGAPFTGGIVPYESDFYVGQIRFAVSAEAGASSGGGPSPVLIVAAVVAVALAAVVMLAPEDDPSSSQVAALKLPDVFGNVKCGAEPGKVAYVAQETERAALSKRERAVFDPHDGVQAGQLFREAELCYAAAGDAAGQARAKAAGDVWREKILADATATRVRLEVALEAKDYVTANSEVRSLLRLYAGEKDPAIEELQRQARKLQAVLSKRSK
jgi:hypothetical protein